MSGATGRRGSAIMLAAGVVCAFAAQGQAPAPAAAQGATAPHAYARLERAQVVSASGIVVQAQLDGGGDTTVLYVNDIKYANAEGGMIVHFTIDNGEVMPGHTVDQGLPVLKDQLVHERDGSSAHHPLVSMSFCIGSVAFSSNVLLEPRLAYTPPLLLSKADAAQFGPIDPQKKNTEAPDCHSAGH